MELILIWAAFVALGAFLGYRKGMKVDGGKRVGVYTVAGAGIGFAAALGIFILLVMVLFFNLPVC